MIEDLGMQIAEAAIGKSEWRARAIVAEAALAEIKGQQDEEEGEGPTLAAVPDVTEETEDDQS